ncbi:exported protein of unknown function [uncultured Sphingopyxis sp.]|uniref:Uncharacterized protein n=1 Tax=uncultured Sphingopyxis sp. TaxID=310581 RepID=A0A1Y5PNJ0_9SPHN|nr:exported protein of unknown function [uncultured Sphingopyxis sp.]
MVSSTPSRARRSRFGVWTFLFPITDRSPKPMSSTRMNRILGRRSACRPVSAGGACGAPCAKAAAVGTVAIAAKLIAAVANNLLAAGSGVVDDRLNIFSPNLPIPVGMNTYLSY